MPGVIARHVGTVRSAGHRGKDDMALTETNRYIVQVFVGALSAHYEALSVEASKLTSSEEIVSCIVDRLVLQDSGGCYELAEVVGDTTSGECKERRLGPTESPVAVMLLWPKGSDKDEYYRFYLREKLNDSLWSETFSMDSQLIKDFFQRFLYQPKDRDYPDLCQLPDLNEQTLLENLRVRFVGGYIYTYVGSILIAVNPFKFHPIYNPKYVKLYQNRRLGPSVPPHIFAVADAAYHCMLKDRKNQCIVISGESGSGKTESTNFLLHHLTALSQKGSHGSGVEQTILSAGPVLEAFGNAKTAHNNNSSRFGKFIQVNYKENGMVHGAVVQKYLLEKSRICSQGRNERNYHVFYYLLAGASDQEKQQLHLKNTDQYNYLNRSGCYSLDNVDEKYEFSRLKQSMEMVGFTPEKQRRLFAVLSAVLLLGNVEFTPKKSAYHHDESVCVKNSDVVLLISELLRVKQETLLAALTSKRAKASGETLVINYRLPEAIAARDAMAKCLYGALFDWIVMQVNHALLSKKDTLRDHQGHSIGVLDIFGFEDFGLCNSFEQLCINYANEHLQYYFNQHVFKYEQQEYRKEAIRWNDIAFMDNTGCLHLIETKPDGLLCILDDQCNFPGATDETLLQKFNTSHKSNEFYEKPQRKEPAFIVRHYAGKVKYQVTDMREKNLDLMRQDIVSVLKNSSMAFVRELVGADPVAVFRWAIVRAFFRGYFAFQEAGRRHRAGRVEGVKASSLRYRNHTPNEILISTYPHKRIVTTSSSIKNAQEHMQKKDYSNSHNIIYSTVGHTSKTKNRIVQNTTNRFSGVNNPDEGFVNPNAVKRYSRRDSVGSGMCPDEVRVMAKASQIVMKNKSFRPRERGKKGLKNLQTVKTLAGRTGLTSSQSQPGKARKQPLTVTAQFQQSLHSLMDTLNQANPFFIRCIKSNSNKIPNLFDEETVQRQLRYTGMLETVRIRQAGYNVRLTYDEFIQMYRILLPKGLLSSQADVRHFLATLNLNRDNYQVGSSKIFMRESEQTKLDYRLHQQIMASIIAIQRWFRACLERKRFIRLRASVVAIQSYWRMVSAQKFMLNERSKKLKAVTKIQAAWRGYKTRMWYNNMITNLTGLQARIRGYAVRKKVAVLRQQMKLRATLSKERAAVQKERNEVQDTSRVELPPYQYTTTSYTTRYNPNNTSNTYLEMERAPLRSSQSLPHQNTTARSYSITQELNTRDSGSQSYSKRKVTKTSKTIDLSEIENIPDKYLHIRKNSCDSISSVKTVDSSRSNIETFRSDEQISISHTKIPSDKARRVLLGDKPKLDGDVEHDRNILSSTCDNEPVWHKRDQFTLHDYKSDSTRSRNRRLDDYKEAHSSQDPHVSLNSNYNSQVRRLDSAPLPLHREIRYNQDGKLTMAQKTEPRNDKVEIVIINAAIERSPTKSVGAASIPEVPLRSIRKPRRDYMCRSVGEEMIEPPPSIDGKAAAFLGTITEDQTQRRARLSGGDTEATARFVSNERDRLSPSHLSKRQKNSANSGLDTLRRRNSDPATKIATVDTHPDGNQNSSSGYVPHAEWKNYNAREFSLEGHKFHKVLRFNKEDKCVSCNNTMDPFVTPGYKCTECKKVFHTKCIQNGAVHKAPCLVSGQSGVRRKPRKHQRAVAEALSGNFNLTGTSEFQDSKDQIIAGAKELQNMQDFITKKMYKMESEVGEKPSEVDRVFKHALQEFKDNLVASYSVANRQGVETLNIKYKDLIANFIHVMETVCSQEHKTEGFAVTMCVNAFRGFMDEFMHSRAEAEKPKTKRKKEKKRKAEDHVYAGHTFVLTIINIPTACEICTSFFMWPIERGLVCQACKLTCHKKCYIRVTQECGGCKDNVNIGLRIFGVALHKLTSGDGKIPVVIDRLITTIEMYGLYTEGIYRKSGLSSKVKELKLKMDESDQGTIKFEGYPVHVLAAVLKSFLRDMPEPLLTFDCYDDFIRAANLTDPADRVSTLFTILKKLPKSNFVLMERLIFHLARVALHEETNRMNASALAIVFAPCILRTNKPLPAQDSLQDIGRQTQCIETIITEQMRKVRMTLADINTLDTACHTATHRLSSLRSSKIFSPEELLPPSQEPGLSSPDREDEEALLVGHIEEIQKEKALLTSALPSLTRATSDDDLLSTDLDGEGSLDDISTTNEPPKKTKLLITRSVSGGHCTNNSSGGSGSSNGSKLPRQISSEQQSNRNTMDESEDDPIMV